MRQVGRQTEAERQTHTQPETQSLSPPEELRNGHSSRNFRLDSVK
jgi:hypothetical protein